MQRSTRLAISALGLSLILAACGGGGSDDNSSTPAASSAASSVASSTASSKASSSAASTATSSAASSTATSAASSTSSAASSAAAVTTGTWTPSLSLVGSSNLLTCASGNYGFNASTSEITAGAAALYSASASNLRLYDGSSDCSGSTWAITYNGSSFATSSAVSTGSSLTGTTFNRYIKIPYTNAATTSPSITVKFGNSNSSGCSAGQIVIADANANILYAGNGCAYTGGTAATATSPASATATATVTKGASGAFYVYYTRVGDSTGGLRVWSIDYTY
ncbi:hypothetical protein ACFONG_02405 [Uliginosibacterium paludis]|uniref:Uncharacterized protein n=1 Tax=Uliginosibacterium paludis TaxID=1615952 RepID=A0ABV2CQN7_9RHOO